MVEKDALVTQLLATLSPTLVDDPVAREHALDAIADLDQVLDNLLDDRARTAHRAGLHYVPSQRDLLIREIVTRQTNQSVRHLIETAAALRTLEIGDIQ